MKLGTPGFTGERLREAREIRGLQAMILAEVVGVSPQAISRYETGRASPSPDVLRKIADVLGVYEHFFTLPPRSEGDRRIFFRSLSAATKSARARAERRLMWLGDLTDYVSGSVELPATNFPELDLPRDHNEISAVDIESAAEDVRAHWGMRDSPVVNVVSLLENHGAIVARDRLGAETLDSLSACDGRTGRPYVLIGKDKGTCARWRHDAAHELGHILLHRNVDRRSLTRRADLATIEDQAHRFAGAFLLPSTSFGEDFFAASLDAMRTIKPKWKTSIGAMIMRARQIDLLSEETARRLWIAYNRRGWRKSEPLDNELPPEEPVVLRRAFELLAEHQVDVLHDVSTSTGLASVDIEALSGLSPDHLRRFEPTVTLRDHNGSNVVPMRRT
ncbi:MAG: XRE family transcriptional regulator [Acidobacteria bacterium]|nr:XRE family transcriptional regulator [Acidobacteriota bacterium]